MYTFRGKQGIQGVTGATGAAGSALTSVLISAQGGVTAKTYSIFSSAAKTGTIMFWGQISFVTSALNTTTIKASINSSGINECISKATTQAISQFNSIPIHGVASIVAGQPFTIDVTVAGGGDIDIQTGSLTYVIQ